MAINLPEALDTLICSVAPGPPYFEVDLPHVTAGSYSMSTAQLCHGLLSESYDVQSVAANLWQELVAADDGNVLRALTIITADQHGCPLVVSLDQPHTWHTLAASVRESNHLTHAIMGWAAGWFTILLLPIRGRSRTPSIATSTSIGRTQADMKRDLVLRDGYTSPISDVTDMDAPELHIPFYDERAGFAPLTVAHIIPFSVNRRNDTLRYLEMFSGGRVIVDSLRGSNINKISNAFLVESTIHDLFDRFKFGIQANTSQVPTAYTVGSFSDRNSPVIRRKAINHVRINFGRASLENLPDSDLCNIHFALGRVLHAAGAAEIVDKILRDEDDFLTGRACFETKPNLENQTALFYLTRKLEALGQVHLDSSESSADEGLRQVDRDSPESSADEGLSWSNRVE